MPHNTFNTLDSFDLARGKGQFYSLKKLEQAGIGPVSKLPVSIRIVLESVLRNVDEKKIHEDDVRLWQPTPVVAPPESSGALHGVAHGAGRSGPISRAPERRAPTQGACLSTGSDRRRTPPLGTRRD